MEVKLKIIKGPEKGRTFNVDISANCLAGRSPDAHFKFSDADPYISRCHFLLEMAQPNVYFTDLDARNPSKVNDLYVKETLLNDGDIIEIGYTTLTVHIDRSLKVRHMRCQNCGQKFQIQDDENPIDTCGKCLNEKEQGKAKADAAPKSQLPLRLTCYQCEKDLSKKADSDGKARELMGLVNYACERCLPKKGEDGGRYINDYKTITKLGQGGMGKVYLAYHQTTGRIVALKEMNIVSKMMVERFNRERSLIKKVSHSNVLIYIDEGQDKLTFRPYLVMEYASDGSLEHLMTQNKNPLAPEAAVQYMIEALKGLEAIHQQGIVHRDLKPDNIFLTRNSNKTLPLVLIPKIADFGISREFSKAGGTHLTKLGGCMGTVLYMPPEQIRDAHNVAEPADLYAMGVTLYYLLTGKYTFDFPSPLDILRFLNNNKEGIKSRNKAFELLVKMQNINNPHWIVLSNEPIPIRQRNPHIPERLAQIIDKAVQKSITSRFQTAGEFRTCLEKIYPDLANH